MGSTSGVRVMQRESDHSLTVLSSQTIDRMIRISITENTSRVFFLYAFPTLACHLEIYRVKGICFMLISCFFLQNFNLYLWCCAKLDRRGETAKQAYKK